MEECIRLVLFDVDGVLTDGGLYVGEKGEVFKKFNAKDGVAVSLLKSNGLKVGLVSGKKSKALEFRINELGFDYAILGCNDKLSAVACLVDSNKLEFSQVAFIGDDVLDVPVMQRVGLSISPADGHALAKQTAHFITLAKGGEGVARESAEYILKKSGLTLKTMYADIIEHIDFTQ